MCIISPQTVILPRYLLRQPDSQITGMYIQTKLNMTHNLGIFIQNMN